MRPMTIEDLTMAFYQLNSRLEREEGVTEDIHNAVDSNAQLLGKMIQRLAIHEQVSGH